MSRKKLAWANKEVETFVCILGEEDVVYDVYVAAAAIDIRPTTKGTVGSGNATSELSWANRSLPTAPLRSDPFRTLQWKCGIRDSKLFAAVDANDITSPPLWSHWLYRKRRDFATKLLNAPFTCTGLPDFWRGIIFSFRA
ncbi:unnamed protein product [Boreogadus saida]